MERSRQDWFRHVQGKFRPSGPRTDRSIENPPGVRSLALLERLKTPAGFPAQTACAPIIHLYGGPGLSEMRFFRHLNAPLEKSFTVVY